MAETATPAPRTPAIADDAALRAEVGGTALVTQGPATRLLLRGAAAADAAGAAFGVAIPTTPLRANVGGGRAALWLGPDEWLLLASAEDAAPARDALVRALADVPHGLFDVSHRQVGLAIEGPSAARTLAAGVALDLSADAFPVGACTRTVFEKAEIVLWRTDPGRFHVEVWRSFAPYLVELLDVVRRQDAAAP